MFITSLENPLKLLPKLPATQIGISIILTTCEAAVIFSIGQETLEHHQKELS